MKKIALLFMILLLIIYCSKDRSLPLNPGEGNEIKETVIFQTTGIDTFFMVERTMGTSSHLLLGKYDDEYTARMLLKFETFPDSAIIDTARVVLYTQQIWGDSGTAPAFEAKMYLLEEIWEEGEVIPGDWALAYNSTFLASTMISAADTDSVVFQFDPEFVNQWIADSTTNFGVWIDCDDAYFIKDFYAREYDSYEKRPILKMIYHTPGHQDTTFKSSAFPAQDATIIEHNLNLDPTRLYIGKGIAFNNYLKFDVADYIDSTATINKADLKLVIDRENSIFDAYGANELKVMRITSDEFSPEALTVDSLNFSYQGSLLNDTITVNITSLVQRWSARDPKYPNNGLLVKSSYENRTIARVALYSSRADSLIAPKLLITYTLPPKLNKN